MSDAFKAYKITDNVYWVGVIDWELRNFHGYSTDRGSTYNAFLIMGDKITLIDTVKSQFKNEMMARIKSVIDPNKIDYIISNHSEMDHSGALPDVIREVKPEKVFASRMGVKALKDHFGLKNIVAVKDGETLSLGNLNLTFMETRMLHWPDSMFTYLNEDKMLFSQDAFGMHLASTERFDDEVYDGILEWEAQKYYANILLPYSPLIKNLLKKVEESGLEFNLIAPDHGPIWRKDIKKVFDWYSCWASGGAKHNKALIVYDTMWKSTEKMANAIADGIMEVGAIAKVMPMTGTSRADVATENLDSGAFILGSPTLNNQIFPTIADVTTYLKGLKPTGMIGAAFGSYGWSGESIKQLEEILKSMNVEITEESVGSVYVPTDEVMQKCRDMGKSIGQKLNEKYRG